MLFLLAGLVVVRRAAWPGVRRGASIGSAGVRCSASRSGSSSTALLRAGVERRRQTVLLQILLFFTKAGAFVFGSGLAIVPFLQQGVVHDFGWLTDHQFLDAVAVALITPGPVVITVAFIGYLVAGSPARRWRRSASSCPVYFFTIVPAPWFQRHRDNPQLRAFVAGTTAAASGAIAGAVVVLGARAIFDVPTAVIALVALGVLWRFRVQEPFLVLAAGVAGLVLWPGAV